MLGNIFLNPPASYDGSVRDLPLDTSNPPDSDVIFKTTVYIANVPVPIRLRLPVFAGWDVDQSVEGGAFGGAFFRAGGEWCVVFKNKVSLRECKQVA